LSAGNTPPLPGIVAASPLSAASVAVAMGVGGSIVTIVVPAVGIAVAPSSSLVPVGVGSPSSPPSGGGPVSSPSIGITGVPVGVGSGVSVGVADGVEVGVSVGGIGVDVGGMAASSTASLAVVYHTTPPSPSKPIQIKPTKARANKINSLFDCPLSASTPMVLLLSPRFKKQYFYNNNAFFYYGQVVAFNCE
jgi:hypothetical protein